MHLKYSNIELMNSEIITLNRIFKILLKRPFRKSKNLESERANFLQADVLNKKANNSRSKIFSSFYDSLFQLVFVQALSIPVLLIKIYWLK